MQRRLIDLQHSLGRREFLRGAAGAGLAGAVLLGGCGSDDSKGPTSTAEAVDPPPETTTIRLVKDVIFPVGQLPLFLAAQFLPAEGFTNVQYIDVPLGSGGLQQLAAGEIDISVPVTAPLMAALDSGDQRVALAGVHNSSWELFGSDRVQSLRDLKGKRIWVLKRDATDPVYPQMAALLAYVGIARSEVEYVELSPANGIQQVLAGTIDAWLATRPISTALRNANVGHVIVNGMMDPPWSQYFGAMAVGNRDFVEQHPAATKRALRAILKATDVCAREPERAARALVDKGFTTLSYDQALDAITGVSYTAWREFDPEDTVRFYALRLKEAGLVKSTPDELVTRATDWRYLEQIKRELGV